MQDKKTIITELIAISLIAKARDEITNLAARVPDGEFHNWMSQLYNIQLGIEDKIRTENLEQAIPIASVPNIVPTQPTTTQSVPVAPTSMGSSVPASSTSIHIGSNGTPNNPIATGNTSSNEVQNFFDSVIKGGASSSDLSDVINNMAQNTSSTMKDESMPF